ncbi:hypothetical protein CLV43_102316 [Umezawaea tangerina]|uniref:Uncharacterized protein n=2 Tax=Umezawaea tangerina TaxID=84725 RepID=A0A2T0TGJ8_9PSEU|nr:hypothetical protein CLV43_102316 [Umezawaea tangerina]
MRRAALYAASGGFLTVAFGVLGAQDADAAAKPPAVKPPAVVPKAAPKPAAKRVVKPKIAVKPKPVAKKTTKPKPVAKKTTAAKPKPVVKKTAAKPKPVTKKAPAAPLKRAALIQPPVTAKPATQAKRKPKATPKTSTIAKPKPAPRPAPAKVPQSVKRAEADAQRQAKTDQQYQDKKRTTAELQKTAPARTAYTESQRGGPPGTTAKKATTKPKTTTTRPKTAPKPLPQPVKRAEADAQRQAKTDQQYQDKKRTTAELQKTAPARTAYTESQRGGPPGTTAKKATTKPKKTTPKATTTPLPQSLRRAEADAERQAKTERQYQDKKRKTAELQKTAPARAAYAESQRGGPPGTAQRKQKQQQTEKATQDLKRTASARAAYAESQRGGAPGSGLDRQIATAKQKADQLGAVRDSGPKGSARAFEATQKRAEDARAEVVRLEGQQQANGQRQEKARQARQRELARAAQAQVDYNDSQAGRPVGERTGLVVELVAPAVSRVTNPRTGEVSLNNFRIGQDAPAQEQLIPLLSEKAQSDAKSCPTGECDAARPGYLGWKTAENIADLCVHSAVECGDDFSLEVAAAVANSGIQPADAEDAQRQLVVQGLAAPIPSLKGPPTGLLPKGSPPPPPVPEPRPAVAPRPQTQPGTGAKVGAPAARANTTPPQGPPPAAGPNQSRQQPDRPNGNVVDGVRLRARLAGQEIAGGHAYPKHVVERGEFRGVHSRDDFAKVVENTIVQGESRPLSNGRTAYWHDGVVVIRNPRAPDGGSAFAPTQGRQYFLNLK